MLWADHHIAPDGRRFDREIGGEGRLPRGSTLSATVAKRIRFIVGPRRIVCLPAAQAARVPASEVNNDVRRSDHSGALVGRNAEVGVAVEGRRIERSVEGYLRPDFDLRREPVLPADAGFDVVGL